MSCFVVPLAQAVATSVIRKRTKKNHSNVHINPWISQLPKLEQMLWGGSLMLIVDHVVNGELTWQYPFFTAMEQKDGIYTMLHEMMTVGLPMSLLITLVYLTMVFRSIKVDSVIKKD